jgi:hypothetical protein
VKLAELLSASRGGPINWNGRTVQMLYELGGIESSARMSVRFLRVSGDRPQALRLKVFGGRFTMRGQEESDIVVWADVPNPDATMQVVPRRQGTPFSVRLWNAWRDSAGIMQAWVGNAALEAEPIEGGVLLRCSDGFGAATFDDLIVEVNLTRLGLGPVDA